MTGAENWEGGARDYYLQLDVPLFLIYHPTLTGVCVGQSNVGLDSQLNENYLAEVAQSY